jgi:hypothetical protein
LTFIEDYPKGMSAFKNTDILKVRIINVGPDWYECIWEMAGLKGYEKYFKIE